VSIIGKVVDVNYARKIAQMPNLSLEEIMLLDKVAKNKALNNEEIKTLKSKKLIEGRKPNFHISSKVASVTGQKDDYIKMKGIDNDYIQKIITDYLTKFESAKRSDLENILLNKLSEGLDISQKINQIKNSLQTLKKQGVIVVEGKLWKMSK
jgi:ATP-dependent DNA helicase RecG